MSTTNSSQPGSPTTDGSSTSRSSSSTGSSVAEIDEVQIKLRQMRRHNKGKGASKLMARFKNMMTPEQRAKNELNKRIDKGLRDVLQLHTPVELSSICGVLGLTALERASVSIDIIIQFCKDDEDFVDAKVMRAVNNMWEGALFEYLKSIGQGFNTCLPDPKLAVMKIWRRGGFHENSKDVFTPHYIQRRVLTRHDTDLSEDIATRAAKLKTIESSLKHVERELYEEHDYTNALTFFQKIADVRRLETEFRDYLINKLELARSELSREKSNQQMAASMLAEGEDRYVKGLEQFNEQLALFEVSSDHDMSSRFQMDQQLTSLERTAESYRQAHSEQSLALSAMPNEDKHNAYIDYEGSSVREIAHIERYNAHIRRIYNSLLQYRGMVEIDTAAALKTISTQQMTIFERNDEIEALKEKVRLEAQRADAALDALASAHKEIKYCAGKLVRMKIEADTAKKQAWQSSIRWSGRCHFLESKIGQLKDIVLTGIQTENKLVVSMCRAINNVLSLMPSEGLQELYEGANMELEDRRSEEMRQEEARLALTSAPKTKGKKKGTAGKKSGGAKKGGAKKSSGGGKKAAAKGGAGKAGAASKGAEKKAAAKATGKPAAKGAPKKASAKKKK